MENNRTPRLSDCIEYKDRPFEYWKWLKENDHEFAKDSRAWAKREALKLWREFRDIKSD